MGKNILVLNHTRMGDLIQTTPLILGLKEKEPDCRITMLANAKFAGILKFVPAIDELITLDIAKFATDDTKEPDVVAMYEYLDKLASNIEAQKFDMVLNLSHSKFSGVLSLLSGVSDVRGFLSTPRGEGLIRDPWLIYFSSILAFRRYNRWNLVDMYMLGAGVKPKESLRLAINPDNKSIDNVKLVMEKAGINKGDLVVGFQAGASREDRRWSPEKFAKVGDYLARTRGAKIVLFGAPSEKALGDEVEAAMETQAINIIGKTGLSEPVGWVKNIDLLVTNDTGTMHIAAAVETKIVAMFFVHARAEETGPYCDGAIILQADIECAPCSHQTVCDHYSCLSYITPEDVIASCETLLDGKTELPGAPDLFTRTVPCFSRFHKDGGVEFVPARLRPMSGFDFYAYLYRPILAETAEKWRTPERLGSGGDVAISAISELKECFSLPSVHDFEIFASRGLEGAKSLIELGREAGQLAEGVKRAFELKEVSKLSDIAGKLDNIGQKVAVISGTHDMVAPLAIIYRRRVENLEGDDTLSLASQMEESARWLEKSAMLLGEAISCARERLF